MKEFDLEKILRVFINQLGLLSINFTINCINEFFDMKNDVANNVEDGIKTLLDLCKNDNYRIIIMYCIFSRLEITTAADIWLVERELKAVNDLTCQKLEGAVDCLRTVFS